jgi:hypothetical protein
MKHLCVREPSCQVHKAEATKELLTYLHHSTATHLSSMCPVRQADLKPDPSDNTEPEYCRGLLLVAGNTCDDQEVNRTPMPMPTLLPSSLPQPSMATPAGPGGAAGCTPSAPRWSAAEHPAT